MKPSRNPRVRLGQPTFGRPQLTLANSTRTGLAALGRKSSCDEASTLPAPATRGFRPCHYGTRPLTGQLRLLPAFLLPTTCGDHEQQGKYDGGRGDEDVEVGDGNRPRVVGESLQRHWPGCGPPLTHCMRDAGQWQAAPGDVVQPGEHDRDSQDLDTGERYGLVGKAEIRRQPEWSSWLTSEITPGRGSRRMIVRVCARRRSDLATGSMRCDRI